ncbi:hypothetical protein GF361_01030 [Candidatus Woesearchaeota archaeon]|nr:hypothetical protein [Candidatus Woesearchaeota archaeon]
MVLEKLIDHYNDYYTKCNKTEKGQFVPSNLKHIDMALKMAVSGGFIDDTGYFLDAGCGDGRVITLSSGKYNLHSIGVEYDQLLAEKAEKHIAYLKKNHILNGVPARIIQGDFTEDSTYFDAGIDFKEIKTFFNYINNQEQIAEKIAEKSPKGTAFLLHRYNSHPEDFSGLEFVKAFTLYDLCPHIEGWNYSVGNIPKIAQLHIYKKI